MRRWNDLGVRALRFNHFFRDGQLHYRGGVPLAAAQTLAPVMAELGWHLQLWIDVKDLPETIPVLKAIGLPVVIDHMGRTDARAGTRTDGFQSLLRALGEGWCWAKLSGAHRISQNAPDYPDARPFHEALVAANPERLVWGGDWPHPRVEGEMPDVGHLFELFQEWTPDRRGAAAHPRRQSGKALWISQLKVVHECPSTTSACSTSNTWRTRSTPRSCRRGRTFGSTGSRMKVPTRSQPRSSPPRMPTRSAPRATNSPDISMSTAICCGARRTC